MTASPQRSGGPRSAMVVGIPARNEVERLRSSLQSIRIAADAVPADIDVVIVVACDSCDDDTPALAAEVAAEDARLHVVVGGWGSAGTARRSAIDHGLEILREQGVELPDIWIATTDSDTIVPPDWLVRHLAYSADGFDAVAGVVDLHDDEDRTHPVLAAFEATYVVDTEDHSHVHGANMGVCAGAYSSVGGFPHLTVAEDHALWHSLRAAGFRCVSPRALVVATSSRLRGRAVGGFADTLLSRVKALDLGLLADIA